MFDENNGIFKYLPKIEDKRHLAYLQFRAGRLGCLTLTLQVWSGPVTAFPGEPCYGSCSYRNKVLLVSLDEMWRCPAKPVEMPVASDGAGPAYFFILPVTFWRWLKPLE